MRARTVIVKLSIREAEELLAVAGNGWGDGDFYELNGSPTKEDRKDADTYCDARDKLRRAMQIAKGGRK